MSIMISIITCIAMSLASHLQKHHSAGYYCDIIKFLIHQLKDVLKFPKETNLLKF